MDGEDRRRHEKELLAFYTEQMNMNLAIHDVSTRLDFDKVCASYKNSLNYAILQMIMTVVTNPKDDVPADGEVEGPLTKRLRALVEDMYLL
uniref:Vacuolar protein sorting-associated protein 28 homolog n=1 Tax=Steinernema glaseri TaxID=37863 RepID=A0A1I7YMF1_9BILA